MGRLMEIVAFSSSDFFTETLGVVSLTTFVGGGLNIMPKIRRKNSRFHQKIAEKCRRIEPKKLNV